MDRLGSVVAVCQAIGAIGGLIFAFLAYRKGRQNKTALDANTVLTQATAVAVDGQASKLEAVARAAGYQQGVIDQAGGAAPAPYPPAKP
jgi:hypothetical protein